MKTELDKEAVEWLVEMDVLQPNLQTTRTMTKEEIQENLIYDEYDEYSKREYAPMNFTEWLIKKLIEHANKNN